MKQSASGGVIVMKIRTGRDAEQAESIGHVWRIAGILNIPVTVVTFYWGYIQGEECSEGCLGMTDDCCFHLPAWPGNRSSWYHQCRSHLSHARVLGTVKGCLTAQLIAQSLIRITEIIAWPGKGKCITTA